jgi:hypothetical protein
MEVMVDVRDFAWYDSHALCFCFNLKDPATQFCMVWYHEYNAQMKIYQTCRFQKALFVKISEFTFHVNKER